MGLFQKKGKRKGLPMFFPAGFEPINRESPGDDPSGSDLITYFTITAQQRSRMGLPPEDRDSYMDAMYAQQLGLHESETILAWGPVYIRPPNAQREFDGTGVVTSKSLMVWWLPDARGLVHVMHNRHDRIQGLEVKGPTAAHFYWQEGTYADDGGKYKVANPNMYLAARLGKKNGHDNRRALSMYYTFAHFVKQQGLG